MKGMFKWLTILFAGVVGVSLVFRPWSWTVVAWAAGIVFMGGSVLLTIIGYAAARYSRPRPASFWLQLWYPNEWPEKMPPVRRFFYRLIYFRPKDS